MATEAQRTQELEILAGLRPGGQSRGQAAVRLDDLAALVDLPDTLKSTQAAGAAPTAAEFDALVEDVHTIAEHLSAVGVAIQIKRNRS